MKAALIDNGSLEPAAHRNLRRLAEEVSERAGMRVDAVSWKHSGRISAAELDGRSAWTLAPWVRREAAGGEREFVFIPFFVSPQGAVGSALRADLEALAPEIGGFEFSFTEGLSDSIAAIAADRILEAVAAHGLHRPAVIVVDHGGPAEESARIRNRVAAEVRGILGDRIGALFAASMESPEGPGFAFNRPLFSEILSSPALVGGDTVVAPLFLAPGRHAGPGGDLARLAQTAEMRRAGLRCHFAGLVGTHPRVPEIISRSLQAAARAGELQLETP